jgi:hypothetical protein
MKTLDLNNDIILCKYEGRTLLIQTGLLDNSTQCGVHHSEDLKYHKTHQLKTRNLTPYEIYFLVGCDVVQYGTNFWTFRRSYCLHFQGNSSNLKKSHAFPRLDRFNRGLTSNLLLKEYRISNKKSS